MTPGFASLLFASAAVQAAGPAPARHPAVDYFVSACIDGRADVGAGTREVRWRELPAVVRKGLRGPDGLRFWEVSQPRLYLVVKADRPRDVYRRFCSVYAPGLDLRQAHDQIWQVIWGEPPSPARGRGSPLMYEFSNFAEGYRFNAWTKPSGWVVLQIAHIGEAGRRQFEAEARNTPRSGPRRRPSIRAGQE